MIKQETFLSIHDVRERTTLSQSTILRQIQMGLFPKSIQISTSRIAWRSSDIETWIASKIDVT